MRLHTFLHKPVVYIKTEKNEKKVKRKELEEWPFGCIIKQVRISQWDICVT